IVQPATRDQDSDRRQKRARLCRIRFPPAPLYQELPAETLSSATCWQKERCRHLRVLRLRGSGAIDCDRGCEFFRGLRSPGCPASRRNRDNLREISNPTRATAPQLSAREQ